MRPCLIATDVVTPTTLGQTSTDRAGCWRAPRLGIHSALAVVVVVMLVVGLAAVAPAATTAPTFATTTYPLLGNLQVVGDFNGDGSPDVAGAGTNFASVRLNNGAGALGAMVQYPAGGPAQDLATGDFTGDGRLDLVVTINDPQTGMSLLRGNGDGSFAGPVTSPNTTGFDSPAIVAADLNNDARLDVVIAHQIACYTAPCRVTSSMSVMLGNGDGTFQPSRDVDVGRGMSEIAVGDFNRDGVRDLAITGDQGAVYRLDGVGDGTFVQRPTMTVVVDTFFIPATDIDVADFNGDTIQDLVVAVPHNGSRTAIVVGNGDGTFRAPTILTEPDLLLPQMQTVADFNGDGFQDLALSLGDGTRGVMEIRNGNGDGTFQPRVLYLPPPPSSVGGIDIVAANLNGDSKSDIALLRGGAFPAFLVMLNTTAAAPPATPAAPTPVSPEPGATPPQPVKLDWTDVSAATSYRVQVDDSSTFSAPRVVDQTVTASELTTANLGARRHWWRVRGINSAGMAGPWSTVRSFTPQPAAPTTALSAVALSPAAVVGGWTSQGTVTLTSAAPSGGVVVTLSSSNTSVATVPPSVTVAAGATSASFTVTTASVATSTSVTISGSFGGVTRSATLTVNPPGTAATLTVTATGRGGERVTSSPAGINAAVGTSGAATFAVGTTVTLRATNERDVIWSGACSSGGNKVKTCTFTLNGSAAVTANVQ